MGCARRMARREIARRHTHWGLDTVLHAWVLRRFAAITEQLSDRVSGRNCAALPEYPPSTPPPEMESIMNMEQWEKANRGLFWKNAEQSGIISRGFWGMAVCVKDSPAEMENVGTWLRY